MAYCHWVTNNQIPTFTTRQIATTTTAMSLLKQRGNGNPWFECMALFTDLKMERARRFVLGFMQLILTVRAVRLLLQEHKLSAEACVSSLGFSSVGHQTKGVEPPFLGLKGAQIKTMDLGLSASSN